jgi:hypothetical protein
MAVTKLDPEMLDVVAAVLAVLDDADASAMLTSLGLSADGKSLVTAANYAAMRTLLGVLADVDKTAWTPTITFDTPGNLAVTYSTQVGRYVRFGSLILAMFSLITSAFTHTTASGALSIAGLPVAVTNSDGGITGSGFLQWQGITKAGYTAMSLQPVAATTTLRLAASGSGQAVANIQASDMPTGGTVRLIGGAVYLV